MSGERFRGEAGGNLTTVRRHLLLTIAAPAAGLALAACGGEEAAETVTVTETVTETVAPEGPDSPAYQLSQDICGALPRGIVAPFLGIRADDSEALADGFAGLARAELRGPARDGCLSALEARD